MRYLHKMAVILFPVVMLALPGCGSSSSGGGLAKDPFETNSQTEPPAGSGAVLSYILTLSTTSPSGTKTVGPNSNVIATASLKDNNGNPVANQPIKFEEVIPLPETEGSVSIASPVEYSSSEGTAVNFFRSNNIESNKDVIIKASTSVKGQLVSSVSTFKIVRSAGNYINFISTKVPTDPDGNLNTLNVKVSQQLSGVDPATGQKYVQNILQLVVFEILDRNGVAKNAVPAQISVYSVLGGCSVFTDSPESPTVRTVTTDNTGIGVFNSTVQIDTPPIGSESSCSVIYKATSPDPNNPAKELFSYGAYIVTLVNKILPI